MPKLNVHLEPPELRGDVMRRSCTIERENGNGKTQQERLYYDIPAYLPQIPQDDAEPFLIATIMTAMAERRDLRVYGEVSATLLANLTEYCAAWHCWLPERYGMVDIQAAKTVSGAERVAADEFSAVATFSGGVDSTFTIWSHASKLVGHRAKNVRHAAMIHGFADIYLSRKDEFSRAYQRARETLASIDIPLAPVVTNFKAISKLEWVDIVSVGLVSILQFLKPQGRFALIGSSAPYNRLVFPLGANPITDHLLSSDTMTVIHDGASFSRTEKVKAIAAWKEGSENLRVCWQGPLKDRNCGVCEKCVRTKLNFQANGLPVPKFLGSPVDREKIRRLKVTNMTLDTEFREIYQYAIQNKISADWLPALRFLIMISPLRNFLGKLKNKVFARFGLVRRPKKAEIQTVQA